MRLYIPATSTLIESLVVTGELPASIGFAVTPALREWYRADDEEELEYIASMAAAKASLEMLVADPNAKRRRAVIALDVADISPLLDQDRAAVKVERVVTFQEVDSALVDDPDIQDEIAAAISVWGALDEDSHFLREQAQSHELLWFARQELPYIF